MNPKIEFEIHLNGVRQSSTGTTANDKRIKLLHRVYERDPSEGGWQLIPMWAGAQTKAIRGFVW